MEDNKCPAVIVLDSVPRQLNVETMIAPRRLRIALVGILIRIEGCQVKGRTSQGERIIANHRGAGEWFCQCRWHLRPSQSPRPPRPSCRQLGCRPCRRTIYCRCRATEQAQGAGQEHTDARNQSQIEEDQRKRPGQGGKPFQVVKRQLGHAKVRYRGLAKNTARLHTLLSWSNLWMAHHQHLQKLQSWVRLLEVRNSPWIPYRQNSVLASLLTAGLEGTDQGSSPPCPPAPWPPGTKEVVA
jgi:hypothetical protein